MVDVESHGLVVAVRAELTDAAAVDTWHGQLALNLARRLAQPDVPSPATLARELERVLAAAVRSQPTPPARSEPDDEVARARRKRDAKTRHAATLERNDRD
jgi:hypothetical protein